MGRWIVLAALTALTGLHPEGATAQDGGGKGKPKGDEGACKRECEEQIKAIREKYHQAMELLRREMEAQIEAIRAGCKHDHGQTGGDGKPTCGCDRDFFKLCLKKQGKGDPDCERETAEHFKKQHPEGGPCHCACEHSKGGGKGNNGLGNGLDPQPPGKPPVNDGPGTGPGNPGNKGGPPGKGGGKGNNGGGNGLDPQPPGKPPVNDGPGAGPGHPGNKGGPPGKGRHEEGSDKGKDPGGPPPGKGKPHESDEGDKGSTPGGKGNGKS